MIMIMIMRGGSKIIGQLHILTLLLSILFIVSSVLTTMVLSNLDPTLNKQDAEGGLILELIHRDLIYPPLKYDPLIARPGSNLSEGKYINQISYHEKQKGDLFTRGAIFYVVFYIGTPGVRQFAPLDTGSAYLWVQCAGYQKGRRSFNNVYNPVASRSYNQSYCTTPLCGIVNRNKCDEEMRCEYNARYINGKYSIGYIGFETISFSPEGYRNQNTSVRKVLFGCGMNNNNTDPIEDGVFGIGGVLQLSIFGETGGRFSFCIGSIMDANYKFNHLALGKDARLEGVYVPYQLMRRSNFGVRMDGIHIGGMTIPLPHNFMVILDSGATLSYLPTDVYNIIKVQVDRIIGDKMVKKNSTEFPNGLCYEMRGIWRGFPNVSIMSGGKTLFVWNIEGMFWRVIRENAFCLAIIEAVNGRPSTLGAVAMQFHNVGFDYSTSTAYFNKKRNGCKLPG